MNCDSLRSNFFEEQHLKNTSKIHIYGMQEQVAEYKMHLKMCIKLLKLLNQGQFATTLFLFAILH